MARRKGAGLIATTACVLAGLILAGSASHAPGQARAGLRGFLPSDQAAAGWTRDDEPQEFSGEDLYTYIDGGAEIYQEYGFVQVIVQDFKNPGGRSLSLEIFEMASPEAAFGMYSFKRAGNGRPLSLGAGGELADYYLNFWKGRYLVTLTGFDSDEATLEGLRAVAAAVDAKITDQASPPALVADLPEAGLRAGGVKYLKGVLGLNNVFPLYTARGLGFRAAVKGDYEDGTSLIVLDYGREEARSQAWPELRAGLEASGKFERLAEGTELEPVFKDSKGRFVAFAPAASHLRVAIGPTAPAALSRAR